MCPLFRKSMYKEQFKTHLIRLGYSKSSQSMLPTCVAEFIKWLEEKGIYHLQEIRPDHIADHYEYLSQRPNKRRVGGLSSKMINHHIYAIRLFLSYQEQIGAITDNPVSSLTFPKPESQQREVLTIEEIKRLYEAIGSFRERAIIGLFYGCGLRRSEGVVLNVRDISFKSALLYVREGKGSKRRVVPISDKVLNDFKGYLNYERLTMDNSLSRSGEENAFITNSLGNRTRGDSYNKVVKSLVGKAEIEKEISLHSLRHSIATQLLENGLSVEYVRDFLGHQHLEATQIYTRISHRKLMELC